MSGGMKDLLGDAPYPASPGYKEPTTSRDAAKAMRGRGNDLRGKALTAIKNAKAGMTADEVAAALGETVLAIRPRISELNASGAIYSSGVRRTNASGLKAKVWRAS